MDDDTNVSNNNNKRANSVDITVLPGLTSCDCSLSGDVHSHKMRHTCIVLSDNRMAVATLDCFAAAILSMVDLHVELQPDLPAHTHSARMASTSRSQHKPTSATLDLLICMFAP